MTLKEIDDIWRLYRREWVTVHTLPTMQTANAVPVYDAGLAWIEENLAGRVRKNEINIVISTNRDGTFWGRIVVYKDNLKGEFKHYGQAEHHARSEGYEEYTIVPRNSKSDHDIRSYGVKKL